MKQVMDVIFIEKLQCDGVITRIFDMPWGLKYEVFIPLIETHVLTDGLVF